MIILPLVARCVQHKMTLIVVVAHSCLALVLGLELPPPTLFKDDGVAPFGLSSVDRAVSTTEKTQRTTHFSLSQGDEPHQEQTDLGSQTTPTNYLSDDQESRTKAEGKGSEKTRPERNPTEKLDNFFDIIESFLVNGYDRQDNRAIIHIDRSTSLDSGERNHTVEVPLMEVSWKECLNGNTTLFVSSYGVVKGLMVDSLENLRLVENVVLRCPMNVTTPAGLYVAVAVRFTRNGCYLHPSMISTMNSSTQIIVCNDVGPGGKNTDLRYLLLHRHHQLTLLMEDWQLIPNLENITSLQQALPSFEILFVTTNQPLLKMLRVVFTSFSSGYVTTPGYGITETQTFMDASHTLYLPEKHSMMLSFSRFSLNGKVIVYSTIVLDATDQVTLSVIDRQGVETILWKKTGEQNIPTETYNTSVRVRFTNAELSCFGFKLYFSFHPWSAAPGKLQNGLFDCSVPHYASFEQHVRCNLQTECEGGEDEGPHCPFSSPACNGSLAVADKCFVYSLRLTPLTWEDAQQHCQERGGQLATIRNSDEQQGFDRLFRTIKARTDCYIGRVLKSTVPNLYRNVWFWLDGTVSYTDIQIGKHRDSVSYIAMKSFYYDQHFKATSRTSLSASSFVCEYTVPAGVSETSQPQRYFPLAGKQQTEKDHILSEYTSKSPVPLTVCPEGYMTRDFLACDLQAACHSQTYVSRCSLSVTSASGEREDEKGIAHTVAFFVCENYGQSIPYTLVCDFTVDCFDGSDENLCQHDTSECSSYRCASGQCKELESVTVCDRVDDCADGSDERYCNVYDFIRTSQPAQSALNRIDFTSHGRFESTALHSSHECPGTHFRCDGNFEYCLPVYVLCNNIRDCPNGEDELQCENYTCPGLYRCRDSRVCVYVQQVCDGVAQCPRQDDELLCDATCPAECGCQGLAFVCRRPFPADSYPSLRYLDASHSGMTLGDLHSNTYLVYVSLASCDIGSVDQMRLSNLQHLDLSHNALSSLDMSNFLHLESLQTLSLMGNPLTLLTSGTSDKKQLRLFGIDLSFCKLSLLSVAPLKNFLTLQTVNVSFSTVDTIAQEGFRFIPSLSTLDLRGNPISNYPLDLLKGFNNLRLIYVDDYKLCCPEMLPEGFEQSFCFAPQNEISSCDDLLRYEIYRMFLWLISSASILGNIGCFFFRNWLHKRQSASGFNVFVSNLCVADSLMGVYLAFVGGADHVYRGSYYRYEKDWLSSIPCSVAGFLSMLSSEVSALTICLITLDRFVVLRFPFSRLKFDRQSAAVGCALTWIVGMMLAAVPLLVPHWTFYGQTGICVPLPVTRQQFEGRGYSFGVMIVFNFLLFLLIAGGQVSIYLSVQANRMSVDTNRKLQDMTIAQRLITVAVSDFLCWFPIGLLGLLASGDVPIPGEVNVALAIFILPLNSALNPFLYTFNMMMEKRRKKKEQKMLAWLEASGDGSSSTSTSAESVSTSSVPSLARSSEDAQYREQQTDEFATKNSVLQSVYTALQCKLVSSHEVRTFLASLQDDGEG